MKLKGSMHCVKIKLAKTKLFSSAELILQVQDLQTYGCLLVWIFETSNPTHCKIPLNLF